MCYFGNQYLVCMNAPQCSKVAEKNVSKVPLRCPPPTIAGLICRAGLWMFMVHRYHVISCLISIINHSFFCQKKSGNTSSLLIMFIMIKIMICLLILQFMGLPKTNYSDWVYGCLWYHVISCYISYTYHKPQFFQPQKSGIRQATERNRSLERKPPILQGISGDFWADGDSM